MIYSTGEKMKQPLIVCNLQASLKNSLLCGKLWILVLVTAQPKFERAP
jgi:hypothetical protein